MPDKDGKLSDAEKALVKVWVEKQWGGRQFVCPICQGLKWNLAEHTVAPMTMSGTGGVIVGGIAYPQIMLISEPCGYTVYFNAALTGIKFGQPLAPEKE